MDIAFSLVLVCLSTVIIAKACDGFEAAADYIGRNMSEGVKGASINAIGSSMPELLTTFVFLFLFADTTSFAGGIGTTAGSSVFNTLIIPALSVLAAIKIFKILGADVSKKVVLRDGLMLIAAEFILIVTIGDTLEWWHGMMLMLLYLAYVGYMFASMKTADCKFSQELENGGKDDEGVCFRGNRLSALLKLDLETAVINGREMDAKGAWELLTISTLVIAIACYILVFGCELFSHELGIHGYFVAVILAAAASSVPDTILSIKDAKKGNYDDAVSNALGSNIFDICFALGLPLFLYTIINGPIIMPDSMVTHITELRVVLLVFTIAAFLIFLFGQSITKVKALSLLGMYFVFVTFVLSRAYELEWARPISEVIKSAMTLI
jgi:cation:H+ antiporter